jgi:hypothetical protein
VHWLDSVQDVPFASPPAHMPGVPAATFAPWHVIPAGVPGHCELYQQGPSRLTMPPAQYCALLTVTVLWQHTVPDALEASRQPQAPLAHWLLALQLSPFCDSGGGAGTAALELQVPDT